MNTIIKDLDFHDMESAARFLFERFYSPLLFFAVRYVEDRSTAKDMVQEVFLGLLESKHRFDSVNNLKAYLYLSVRNRCLKYLRHEMVRKRYSQQALAVHETEQSYLNRMLQEEVYRLLVSEIEALPPQCRKVFELILEGKANPDIAVELGITVETVKSHKKTGKKILHERLKGIISSDIMAILMGLLH